MTITIVLAVGIGVGLAATIWRHDQDMAGRVSLLCGAAILLALVLLGAAGWL